MKSSRQLLQQRSNRVRRVLKKRANGKPRLSVFRSAQHIYAQVIDDVQGRTLAQASSLDKDLRSSLKSGGNKSAAEEVGKLVAQRAVKAGVDTVIFDRGGYLFHGLSTFNVNTLRNWKQNIVAETQIELDVLTLNFSTITDTVNFKCLGISIGYTGYEIGNQRT